MAVFGKKCPTCGGTELIARPPTSWINAIPLVQAYSCAACRQQLVTLLFYSIGVDHRHFPRKHLPPFFLARIPGECDQYVRIKNISEGGLSFDHHYNAAPFGTTVLTIDLYNCNDGSSLEQLPTEIVATTEHILDINGYKTTILNHCARFVNLNQAQKKVLRSCLDQYGN